jgi:hypothetical protein
LQVRILDLRLDAERPGDEQRVLVEGTSSEGQRVLATVDDGPTAHLVMQIVHHAGPDVVRRRLTALPQVWACTARVAEPNNGVLLLRVSDGGSIHALCEHVRTAVFTPERGEPILEVLPEGQGADY